MRIGILGGTFDPIHLGHLRAAEEIGEYLNLQKVYLIPCASPPHKNRKITSFRNRLAMVRLALGESSLLEVMDLEGRRPGLSYSIETLREFHRLFYPCPELYFILGSDAFLEIESWKEYQRLFAYAHFTIIVRAGVQRDKLEALLSDLGTVPRKSKPQSVFDSPSGKTLLLMEPTLMDISSTRIREMVQTDHSIRFLVPDSVRDYIIEKRLYKTDADHR